MEALSGEDMFLVTEEQDSTYSLKSTITIHLQSTWHKSIIYVMYFGDE